MCSEVSLPRLVFCLLMTSVFKTSCPLPPHSLSVSLFALPSQALSPLILSFPLLFLPPPPPLSVLLRRPTPDAGFKQPALGAADTSSMQIESPPASLSHSFPVLLFSLPFRYYVVMRASCLYSQTFLTLPFFCFHICSLPHALSCCRSLCAVLSLLLPLVTLIRTVSIDHR